VASRVQLALARGNTFVAQRGIPEFPMFEASKFCKGFVRKFAVTAAGFTASLNLKPPWRSRTFAHQCLEPDLSRLKLMP